MTSSPLEMPSSVIEKYQPSFEGDSSFSTPLPATSPVSSPAELPLLLSVIESDSAILADPLSNPAEAETFHPGPIVYPAEPLPQPACLDQVAEPSLGKISGSSNEVSAETLGELSSQLLIQPLSTVKLRPVDHSSPDSTQLAISAGVLPSKISSQGELTKSVTELSAEAPTLKVPPLECVIESKAPAPTTESQPSMLTAAERLRHALRKLKSRGASCQFEVAVP